jgi:hypothetical protein
MWGRSNLQTEGTRTDGSVLAVGPAKDPSECHLRISVTFDDGETVEFEQDFPTHFNLSIPDVRGLPLANGVYAPVPTAVPVSFTVGEKIPVRYDSKHHHKLVVDWSAVELQVVPAWKKLTPEGQEWCRRYPSG